MKTLREAIVLILVAAVPAVIALAWHPELADPARTGLESGAVRLSEILERDGEVLWVDTRNSADYARAHIPGAIAFDEGTFDESLGSILAAWSPGRTVVVYCDSSACTRSREIAERLREAGLAEVHHLHGGWESWSKAQTDRK